MPVWATVTLTLGVAIITGATSLANQRMSLKHAGIAQNQVIENERQAQLRNEAYREFRKFMIAVSEAVDALVFSARSWKAPSTPQTDKLITDATEKVRQVRIHSPIMLAYAGADGKAARDYNALIEILGQAAYSLRYHAGHTTAAGDPWAIDQIEQKLRPGADELQKELAATVIQAISQPRSSA